MSTKIYDAYRIPKSKFEGKFITDVLKKLKNDTIEFMANSEDDLKAIHVLTAVWVKKNEGEEAFKEFVEKERFRAIHKIKDYLRECEQQVEKSYYYYDIDFDCTVFEDNEHWYVIFWANQKWQWDLLEKWESEFDWLEDYHYQNQTDPPEDIPYEEFKKRGDKWDEFLNEQWNFRDGLQYVLFDTHDFWHLVFMDGKFDNPKLVYNFDELKLKDVENES